MEEIMIYVVLTVIALAVVVKTVFYGIEVFSGIKANKKCFKLVNKLLKKYETLFEKVEDYMND